MTVRTPENCRVVGASSEPNGTGESSVTWTAGTDLEGFELVLASTGTCETEPAGAKHTGGLVPETRPEISVLGTLLAVLGGMLLAMRSHR